MDNTTIGACPDCEDSGLSWAGNLAGLLTFALGIFVTVTALLAATRNAEKEIAAKNKLLDHASGHISRIKESISRLKIIADRDYYDLKEVFDPAVTAYEDAVEDLREHMKNHFETPKKSRCHIKWWNMGKKTAAKFANLQSCSEHVTAAQLTFVQRLVIPMSQLPSLVL